MTPEAKVKAKVRKVLEELGAYYVMPVTGGFGRQGAPDFLVCLHGKFIGIECKAGKNKPTPLQVKNLEQIEKAGGEAFVLNEDGVEQLREVLDSIVFSYKAL
jgi:Holliday junction resolvase